MVVITIAILIIGALTAVYAIDTKTPSSFNCGGGMMNNLTDEQYKQMIEMMNKNGYTGMADMMGSISGENMLDMHNSMMGRFK